MKFKKTLFRRIVSAVLSAVTLCSCLNTAAYADSSEVTVKIVAKPKFREDTTNGSGRIFINEDSAIIVADNGKILKFDHDLGHIDIYKYGSKSVLLCDIYNKYDILKCYVTDIEEGKVEGKITAPENFYLNVTDTSDCGILFRAKYRYDSTEGYTVFLHNGKLFEDGKLYEKDCIAIYDNFVSTKVNDKFHFNYYDGKNIKSVSKTKYDDFYYNEKLGTIRAVIGDKNDIFDTASGKKIASFKEYMGYPLSYMRSNGYLLLKKFEYRDHNINKDRYTYTTIDTKNNKVLASAKNVTTEFTGIRADDENKIRLYRRTQEMVPARGSSFRKAYFYHYYTLSGEFIKDVEDKKSSTASEKVDTSKYKLRYKYGCLYESSSGRSVLDITGEIYGKYFISAGSKNLYVYNMETGKCLVKDKDVGGNVEWSYSIGNTVFIRTKKDGKYGLVTVKLPKQ